MLTFASLLRAIRWNRSYNDDGSHNFGREKPEPERKPPCPISTCPMGGYPGRWGVCSRCD